MTDPKRATGRTTGLMLQALGEAVKNPGTEIEFIDHHAQNYTQLQQSKEVKSFSVISPIGEIIHSKNTKQFCRDNNLNNGHFSQVLNGKRQSHKGFRLYKG